MTVRRGEEEGEEGEKREEEERLWVLSIQSFVVHGYVGNKCSMFALQTLGLDVDPLCTVLFSNHTGYPAWRGASLSAAQLDDLVAGLAHPAVNALARYTHVLSGYCRDAASLATVARTVQALRRARPRLVYLCDPVMGDDGALYVPRAVADVYRTTVVRLADTVKLNQTEAETLTGVRIADLAGVAAALAALAALGPRTAVISSCRVADTRSCAMLARALHLVPPARASKEGHQDAKEDVQVAGKNQDPDAQDAEDDAKAAMAVSKYMFVFGQGSDGDRFVIGVPVLEGAFSGTGDLFSALLLAWMARGDSAAAACEKTVAAISCVLRRTIAAHSTELLLVQSRRDIEAPPAELFRAVPLPSLEDS